jgi:hypothetical protein
MNKREVTLVNKKPSICYSDNIRTQTASSKETAISAGSGSNEISVNKMIRKTSDI